MRDRLTRDRSATDWVRKCNPLHLYLRSDLRAQGLLTSGPSRSVLLALAAGATALGCYGQIRQLLDGAGPSTIQLAALSLAFCAIFAANGLTVGQQTLSSGAAHRAFLATQPLTQFRIARIHSMLIASRALTGVVFLLTPVLAAVVATAPGTRAVSTAFLAMLTLPIIPVALTARWAEHSTAAMSGLFFLIAGGLLLLVFGSTPGQWAVPAPWGEALIWLAMPGRLLLGLSAPSEALLLICVPVALWTSSHLAAPYPRTRRNIFPRALARLPGPVLLRATSIWIARCGPALVVLGVLLAGLMVLRQPVEAGANQLLSNYFSLTGPTLILVLWARRTMRPSLAEHQWWSTLPLSRPERQLIELSAVCIATAPLPLAALLLGAPTAPTLAGWWGSCAVATTGSSNHGARPREWIAVSLVLLALSGRVLISFVIAEWYGVNFSLAVGVLLDSTISAILIWGQK